MRAVNLLPADANAPRQRLPFAPIVLAGTAPLLAAALVYLGYSVESSKVSDKQLALDAVKTQIVALRPTQQLVSQSGRIVGERARREAELADALGRQVPWDVTFDQISRVLPANAWLTSLGGQSPVPVVPSAPTATNSSLSPVTLQGMTYTQADVARVLARLALVPALTDVALVSTQASTVGTRTMIQFSVSATLRGGGVG
jgi:Tfp pilus assembly protein PilN